MVTEGLALQKLQHCRCQRLGNAVDFIQKQDALLPAGLLHLLIDRRHDLTHRILCHRHLPALKFLFHNKWQTDRTLTGMVRDRIGHQPDTAFLSHLFHDLCLADTRRTDQQNRPLADRWNFVLAVFIF